MSHDRVASTGILLNDYAGHPGQLQLGRWLGANGCRVSFVYCSSNTTPHGDLADGEGLELLAVDTGGEFEKYRLLPRLIDELRYGLGSIRLQRSSDCDVVITSNVPLISLALIAAHARLRGKRWIFWLQDVQSGLADSMVSQRRRSLVRVLRALEIRLLRAADHVVAISESFRRALEDEGVDPARVHVIENWAPIEELPMRPRDNTWAATHGLSDKFVYLYSGTLGRKHSPERLLALADHFADQPDVRVVVVSEGEGAAWLRDQVAQRPRPNLVLLPLQDYADLPDVLGAADVLVALLEETAGRFSIPSKVLTYMTAARPLLACVPADNLAHELIVDRTRAGLAATTSTEEFLEHAECLRALPDRGLAMGGRARAYAEDHFPIASTGERFQRLAWAEPVPGRSSLLG